MHKVLFFFYLLCCAFVYMDFVVRCVFMCVHLSKFIWAMLSSRIG